VVNEQASDHFVVFSVIQVNRLLFFTQMLSISNIFLSRFLMHSDADDKGDLSERGLDGRGHDGHPRRGQLLRRASGRVW